MVILAIYTCFMSHRYTLMTNCWRTRGEERPNFTTVFSQLRDLHSKHAAFVDSQYDPSLHTPELNFSTFGKNLHEEKPANINIDTASRAGSRGYRSGTFPGQFTKWIIQLAVYICMWNGTEQNRTSIEQMNRMTLLSAFKHSPRCCVQFWL